MNEQTSPHRLALSVSDFGSSDIPDLEQEIRKCWKGDLVYSRSDKSFSRSECFNVAIRQAKGNLVFVCDADMSLPDNISNLAVNFISHQTAWFPVCQWQVKNDSQEWKWFTAGTGIFAAHKKQLEKTGLLNEKFSSWGKEDWDLFFRFYKSRIMPLRTRVNGLYHHWHPESRPPDFENMF